MNFIISLLLFRLCYLGSVTLRPKFKMGGYYLDLNIGKKSYEHSLQININNNFTWLSRWDFRHHVGDTGRMVKEINIIITECEGLDEGLQYEDDLIFNDDFRIKNFNFYIFNRTRYFMYEMGLGLGFGFLDERFSIVHHLYNMHKISKKQFTIRNIKTLEIELVIGEPPSLLKHWKYEGRIPVQRDKRGWVSRLENVYINNVPFRLDIDFSFNNVKAPYILSKKLFDFFVGVYLKEEIEKKVCRVDNEVSDHKMIFCDGAKKKELQNVKFEFFGIKVAIHPEELFHCERICRSYFSYDESDPDFNGFGMNFLNKFGEIVFDYEDASVTFYSDESGLGEKRTDFYIVYIYIICSLISVFEIFLIVFVKKINSPMWSKKT